MDFDLFRGSRKREVYEIISLVLCYFKGIGPRGLKNKERGLGVYGMRKNAEYYYMGRGLNVHTRGNTGMVLKG